MTIKSISLAASTIALGACSYQPAPLPDVTALEATASPAASLSVGYQDPLADYTYRGPTGPRDWRLVNEEQSEGN